MFILCILCILRILCILWILCILYILCIFLIMYTWLSKPIQKFHNKNISCLIFMINTIFFVNSFFFVWEWIQKIIIRKKILLAKCFLCVFVSDLRENTQIQTFFMTNNCARCENFVECMNYLSNIKCLTFKCPDIYLNIYFHFFVLF